MAKYCQNCGYCEVSDRQEAKQEDLCDRCFGDLHQVDSDDFIYWEKGE